jgi:hypothetical protein
MTPASAFPPRQLVQIAAALGVLSLAACSSGGPSLADAGLALDPVAVSDQDGARRVRSRSARRYGRLGQPRFRRNASGGGPGKRTFTIIGSSTYPAFDRTQDSQGEAAAEAAAVADAQESCAERQNPVLTAEQLHAMIEIKRLGPGDKYTLQTVTYTRP